MEERRLTDNAEFQLVVKMGQVEMNVDGFLSDMRVSALMLFDEINVINEGIIHAGEMKLSAMRDTLQFRKTIISKEWRHACLKTILRDLKAELESVQRVKVKLV